MEPRSVVVVATNLLPTGGRELRVHLDTVGLQALREGQQIVAEIGDAEADHIGFVQVVVTTDGYSDNGPGED